MWWRSERGVTLIELLMATAILGLITVGVVRVLTAAGRKERLIAARESAEEYVEEVLAKAKRIVDHRKLEPFGAGLTNKPYIRLTDCSGTYCRGVDAARVHIEKDPVTGDVISETEQRVSVATVCRTLPVNLAQGGVSLVTVGQLCNATCPAGQGPAIRVTVDGNATILPKSSEAREHSVWAMALCIGIEDPVNVTMDDALEINVDGGFLAQTNEISAVRRRVAVPLNTGGSDMIQVMH
jgi:prepilin-type N-terminal cleavage/methylation domain-containing protein